MDSIIHLERVTKDYGKLRALDNVSLDIGPGITGLLGPNGAGKSTLIKVLLGLVRLSGGSGRVLGFEVGRQVREIRHRVGYMPEDDCYISGMSGVESVQFVARLSGIPGIEALRRGHEIMDFCGVGQERYRKVQTYSTGMRQKLKFAQAIVHDPPFLILDEPTSALDPEERKSLLNRVSVLSKKAGKAVLLCTHILPDVQSICQNVIILARGQVRTAAPLEVLNRPAFPAFHVRPYGPAAPLIERLRRENINVEIRDDGTLTIHGDQTAEERLLAWAREAGVGIRSLKPAQNSLEQVFVDAVRGQQPSASPSLEAAHAHP